MDENKKQKRRFACPICNKRFLTKRCLTRHGKVHQGEEAKVHPCPKCNIKFKREDHRDAHLYNIHSDDKLPAPKIQWQPSTTAKDTINGGIFKCPNCEKAYNSYNSLYVHNKRKHMAADLARIEYSREVKRIRLLDCPICGKTLKSKQGFIYHKNNAHKNNPIEFNRLDERGISQNLEQSTTPPPFHSQSFRGQIPQQSTRNVQLFAAEYISGLQQQPSANETQDTTAVVHSQTSATIDESFFRMEAINRASNSLASNCADDGTYGTLVGWQPRGHLLSAEPFSYDAGINRGFISYPQYIDYPTEGTSYTPYFSWRNNVALETAYAARGIPNYVLPRSRDSMPLPEKCPWEFDCNSPVCHHRNAQSIPSQTDEEQMKLVSSTLIEL